MNSIGFLNEFPALIPQSRPINFGKKVKSGDKGGTRFPIEVGHYYLKEKYRSGKTREKAFLMTKIMRSKNLNP